MLLSYARSSEGGTVKDFESPHYLISNVAKGVNGSENSKGHQKHLKTRRDAYSGLDLSIYVIKSPIQLVRQSL